MEEIFLWTCRRCLDYGQSTFNIGSCPNCGTFISIENITKPLTRKQLGPRLNRYQKKLKKAKDALGE